MKLAHPIPVVELATQIKAKLIGDSSISVTGINEIHKVEKGDVTFSDVEKYFEKALRSPASVVILNKVVECPPEKAILVCEQPFEAYNSLVKKHRPFVPLNAQIAETAKVHPTAILEPGVVIGHHAEIGAHCYLQANVYIGEYSILQEGVVVQPGTVIGSDAFYYKKEEDGYKKWRSGGRVVIEKEVEIGACCTINKGVSGDTIIGAGTKLDCQVHVGHGVVIGKNCLIAAQTGIGGKTIIEDKVTLYGQVGIAHNTRVGAGAVVMAQSGISKDIAGKKVYFGYPAGEIKTKYKELAALRHLPDFLKKYYQ